LLGECLNISAGGSFSRISFIDWVDLFREFLEWKESDRRVVIILDEFSYIIKLDKGMVSQFQKASIPSSIILSHPPEALTVKYPQTVST